MPLSSYYGGHGRQVAEQMKRRYGKDWQRVFYATANKRGQTPEDAHREALRRMRKK